MNYCIVNMEDSISSCIIMIVTFLVVPRYPHPNTENEQWMTWIDRNISQSSHGFETVGGFLQGMC